jgi:type II secretory pathway pseudopilin PulG
MRRWLQLSALRPHRNRGERGFTVVEIVLAASIFAVVMAAAALGLGQALSITRGNRSRSVAANLASQKMDQAQTTSFSALPLGETSSTQVVDGVPYTVVQDDEWVAPSATAGPCDTGGGGAPAYLRVTVMVTWPNMHGVQPVQSQTLVAPPVGAYSANSGGVAVSVRDAQAQPQNGTLVTLSGSSTSSQYTTADGCAFFAYQTPGSYTVKLNMPLFVDGQGTPNPTQTVTVVAGSTVSAHFDYDLGATLSLTLIGSSGGLPPDGLPVTVGNSHLLPIGTRVIAGQVGAVRIVPNLFPYSDGFELWAGDCADSDPLGTDPNGVPYYPGASREEAIDVSPGATSTGTVTLQSVQVRVRDSGNKPVVGAVVTVSHLADNGCPTGKSFTLPGATDNAGKLDTALPYGSWTFAANGRSPVGSWPINQLAPPASSTLDVDVTVQ